MKRDVAVVILNHIQYVNIIPGIDALMKRGYKVDIYCPIINTKDGFDDMYNDNIKNLKENGYKVYNNVNKIKYKVLLEPYPYMDIISTYKIRYRYSNISAKPDIVYKPENYLRYDAILCSGPYEANILGVFTKTIITGNLLFKNFKKKKKLNTVKKTLLYLPTYGKESSIDLMGEYLKKLRDRFYIVSKIHHGTTFLKNEKQRINLIKMFSDEFYDCKKDICDLLSKADVVLTDNSAAIFDALYTSIPVAVFCSDINENKLMNFDTTQFQLYKSGILPYTNKKEKISEIIDLCLSDNIMNKQREWSHNNFFYSKNSVKDFTNVIENYLNDNVDDLYLKMHEIIREKYIYYLNETNRIPLLDLNINNLINDKDIINTKLNQELEKNQNLLNEINSLIAEKDQLENELSDYRKGKLYKISTKIYKLRGKLKWKKR